MQDSIELTKVPMYMTQGFLAVPIQAELEDRDLLFIQKKLLERVQSKNIKGVVIDLSGVNILDSFLGKTVLNTVGMTTLLGANTVVTGLQPGVVASFVDLDLRLDEMQTALTLEDGLSILELAAGPEMNEDAEEISDCEEESPDYEDADTEVIESDE